MNSKKIAEVLRQIGSGINSLADMMDAFRQIGTGFNNLADLMETDTKDVLTAPVETKTKAIDKKETTVATAPAAKPTASVPKVEPDAQVATTTPATANATDINMDIKFEDIRGTLAGKAAAGYKSDVKNILKKHNLTCLSDIEKHPELFAEITAEAEAIGNG